MKVNFGFEQFQKLSNAVVTIGFYDGVHHGHRKILKNVSDKAKAANVPSVVLTFWPHPKFVLNKNPEGFKLLTTIDEKIELIRELEIDHMIILPFTEEFSEMTADAFVRNILIDQIGTSRIVIGYDHRFGKNREGGYDFLKANEKLYGFIAEEISRHDIDDNAVSSTRIREALQEGNVTLAASLSDSFYSISGEVVKGKQLGRTIGYPTANIFLKETYKLIPKDGVYAVKVQLHGRHFKGMLNIGNNPTIPGKGRSIEVNILDFNEDIYGETLTVRFVKRIRSEEKFNGLDALKAQLANDREATVNILN